MKFLFLTLLILVGCQSEDKKKSVPAKPQAEIDALIVEYFKEYNPAVVEMVSGVEQAREISNLIHNSPVLVKVDNRNGTLSPEAHVWHVLNDPEYGVICGGFALAVFDSLRAFGYKTRMVQLFTNGVDNHIANEVEIDGKWIALDSTFNVVFKNAAGNLMSYQEAKVRVQTDNFTGATYNGHSRLLMENYYMPYEPYFYHVRALPVNYRGMPYWETILDGEERY